VVERRPVPAPLLEEARERIGGADPDEFLFFSIVDAINPRKNIRDLLFAFSRVRARSPRRVRLILKQYRETLDFSSLEGVCSVNGDLSDAQMRALHMISHAYVSAHHAEGWGLGLSEAMACGKPVIATGYSGNMDFMDDQNSFPIPYTLGPVPEEMSRRLPWFTPDMLWANIDKDALIRAMQRVAAGRCDPGLCARAADIARTFSPGAVAEVMRALL
jgi:glycosyltransferase involved in cell wall biosynthesis